MDFGKIRHTKESQSPPSFTRMMTPAYLPHELAGMKCACCFNEQVIQQSIMGITNLMPSPES